MNAPSWFHAAPADSPLRIKLPAPPFVGVCVQPGHHRGEFLLVVGGGNDLPTAHRFRSQTGVVTALQASLRNLLQLAEVRE